MLVSHNKKVPYPHGLGVETFFDTYETKTYGECGNFV